VVKATKFEHCYRGAFSMALRFAESGEVLEAKVSSGTDVTAEQRECVLKVFRAVKVPPFNRRYLNDDGINAHGVWMEHQLGASDGRPLCCHGDVRAGRPYGCESRKS
jgi:hypothetical protein